MFNGAVPRPVFLRGDTDGNGIYTLGDAVQVLERLFAGREEFTSGCDDAGDSDDNGVFTIGDAIWLLNYQFAGGPPPEPPAPHCGTDPTPEPEPSLGCDRYPIANCP